MDYKISVIIRTYNEAKHVGEVMDSLKKQNYKNFEVIVIDSESTDDTLNIINKYMDDLDIKIHHILKKDFDYSYSSNFGVEKSSGDIICFLSGHSVPVYEDYLKQVNDTFKNSSIGGCYGDVIALEDGSIYEKVYNKLGIIKNSILGKKKNIVLENKIHPGILSCSNACVRKEILIKHPFAKELGKNGGEDVEVAYRIIKDGMYVAMNPALLVKHSHGKKLKAFIKELKNWKKIYREVERYIDENK